MSARTEFVVVKVQIVGSLDDWGYSYDSDLVRKPTRRSAIAHGWRVEGHDDWLLAHLRGDTMVGLSWQYEDRDEPEERARIAANFGWNLPADVPDHLCHGVGRCEVCGADEPPQWPRIRGEGSS